MGENNEITVVEPRASGHQESGTRAGADNLLEGRAISLGFRGVKALTNVNFSVHKGEFLSIIGPNGAGKTSLLNCISGRYRPDQGELICDGGQSRSCRPQRVLNSV